MKHIRVMDAVDRRIIELLPEDATLSSADLAQQAGASAASCWRRIKALERAGILGRTVRLVDQEAVRRGVKTFFASKLKYSDHKII